MIDEDTYRKNMTDTITMLKTLTQLSTNNQMMKGQGTRQKAKIEINVLEFERLLTTARTTPEAIDVTTIFSRKRITDQKSESSVCPEKRRRSRWIRGLRTSLWSTGAITAQTNDTISHNTSDTNKYRMKRTKPLKILFK